MSTAPRWGWHAAAGAGLLLIAPAATAPSTPQDDAHRKAVAMA
ncbi:hypothetical protein [Protofrankia coriariae]|nr:hypothetical protein [Protofrankia coriariae]